MFWVNLDFLEGLEGWGGGDLHSVFSEIHWIGVNTVTMIIDRHYLILTWMNTDVRCSSVTFAVGELTEHGTIRIPLSYIEARHYPDLTEGLILGSVGARALFSKANFSRGTHVHVKKRQHPAYLCISVNIWEYLRSHFAVVAFAVVDVAENHGSFRAAKDGEGGEAEEDSRTVVVRGRHQFDR
ncbi:hypothetical protein B0H14DRAFT_3575403 [Mycena olivaceomarginata]|nr:hypothetical protein B0H14DRAFT_3575403 [Mycena olivaceomarginata]